MKLSLKLYSCSCVPNLRNIITQHKNQVLNQLSSAYTETPLNTKTSPCSCCNCNKCDWLLEGKCCTKHHSMYFFYKASICIPNSKTISYYGCCETNFKACYYNYKQNFKYFIQETSDSFQSLFSDSKMWVIFQSLDGPLFVKPNRTAAAHCTANCAWWKKWPSCGLTQTRH